MTDVEKNSELVAKLEALLFIYGESLTYERAAKLLEVRLEEVKTAASVLKENYALRAGGLTVLEHDGAIQLTTAAQFGAMLDKVFKAEMRESLTPAALETLSIITYGGPLGRPEIDFIRGVNSTFSIRALLLRGLIDRAADPKRPNAFVYQASAELLRHLGVAAIGDLPEYERFRTLVGELRQPTTADTAKEEKK